jgi:hypothetical protein
MIMSENKKREPTFVRIILEILIIVVVVAAVYFVYSFIDARKEARQYCAQLTEGMSMETAKTMALERHLRFMSGKSPTAQGMYTAYVYGYGVTGRYVCIVDHDGQTVIKTKMH